MLLPSYMVIFMIFHHFALYSEPRLTLAAPLLSPICHQTQSTKGSWGSSLAVQWLGLCAFTAEVLGSIPGQGTKIPEAARWAPPPQKAVGNGFFLFFF